MDKRIKYLDYVDEVQRIINDFKECNDIPLAEPLDTVEIEYIADDLKSKIKLLEGKMTFDEYLDKESGKNVGKEVASIIMNDVMAPFKNFNSVSKMLGLSPNKKEK